MQGVNKAIVMGHLGHDVELRYTQGGTAVCNLSVATNRRYKDGSGQQHDETEWHRITLWARLAEVAGEYLRKGQPVYIEGRLQTRQWQDKNGVDRYSTEIVAQTMQLISGGDSGGGSGGAPAGGGGSGGNPGGNQGGGAGSGAPPDFDQDFDDDIPFGTRGFGLEWRVS